MSNKRKRKQAHESLSRRRDKLRAPADPPFVRRRDKCSCDGPPGGARGCRATKQGRSPTRSSKNPVRRSPEEIGELLGVTENEERELNLTTIRAPKTTGGAP